MERYGLLYNIIMRNSDLDCFSDYEIIRFIKNILDIIRDFWIILGKCINIIFNILVMVIAIARIFSRDMRRFNLIIYFKTILELLLCIFLY